MKTILILLLVSAMAFAGVLEPKAEDIQEAMRLWLSHCNSGKSEGQEGSSYIFCKIGKTPIVEQNDYDIKVTPAPEAQKQIIFVQAPPLLYRHNLAIRGGASAPAQTKIYVLPAKSEHTYDYQDNRDVSTAVSKPHLYFLNNNLGEQPGTNQPRPDGGYQYNNPQGERTANAPASRTAVRQRAG